MISKGTLTQRQTKEQEHTKAMFYTKCQQMDKNKEKELEHIHISRIMADRLVLTCRDNNPDGKRPPSK